MEEYSNVTVTWLKALARERGIGGYSRMRKAELITFLLSQNQSNKPEPSMAHC